MFPLRCPHCGSNNVEPVTDNPAPTGNGSSAVGFVAVGVLVLLGAAIWFGVSGKDKGQPTPAEQHAPKTPQPETKHVPKAPQPETKHAPENVTPTKPPDRQTPTPDTLPIAPQPHVPDYSIPPPVAAFATAWVRVGKVETRVIGVQVGSVPLRSRDGRYFNSGEPGLRGWIETRAVAGSGVSLRRWASGLNPAKLYAGGSEIPKSSVVSGSDVRGELYGTHQLLPGEPPTRDVLVFDLPGPRAEGLLLTLEGGHVGQSGDFRHIIPVAAWKK